MPLFVLPRKQISFKIAAPYQIDKKHHNMNTCNSQLYYMNCYELNGSQFKETDDRTSKWQQWLYH